MTPHELRRHFGMVLQDTWFFEGTIRDNQKSGAKEEVGDHDALMARGGKYAELYNSQFG